MRVKNLIKYWPIPVVVLVVFAWSAHYSNSPNVVQIGSFTSNDGHVFGNLFVKYTTNHLISDLYIRNESSNLLFRMDSAGIYLSDGETIPVSNDFYGYKIFSKSSDKMVVSIFTNGGKHIGDSTTVYWDYKTNMFKLLDSTSDQSSTTFAKTLKTLDSAILGDVNIGDLPSTSPESYSGKDLDNVFASKRKASPAPEIIVDKDLGFSFIPPSGWLQREVYDSSSTDPDFLFGKDLIAPDYEEKFLLSNCVVNEEVEWANPTPTKKECETVLSNLTDAEKEKYSFYDTSLFQNIYVKVFKMDQNMDLYSWLISKYRTPHLDQYLPGEKIELAGEIGYFSSTSCCASMDNALVISKNGYVYELGTNGANSLLEMYKDNFKLLQ